MSGDDGQHPLRGGVLVEPLLNIEERKDDSSLATVDGSVSLQGKPVLRSKTGAWKACYYLFSMEVAERIVFYAVGSNLVLYLAEVLQESLQDAVKHVNYWVGAVFLIPLLGGFIADTFLGRYWTAIAASVVHVAGGILLTLSVSLPALRPPQCGELLSSPCPKASGAQVAVFYSALYLLAVGSGGIKPCVSSLGADQFDDHNEEERALKYNFFNLWCCGIGAGIIFSVTVMVYVEDNIGWGWASALVTTGMALAIAAFVSGTPLYRHKLPQGSPLTQFARICTAAISKLTVPLPPNKDMLYEEPDKVYSSFESRKMSHTDSLSFLDKAAIQPAEDPESSETTGEVSRWKLCTVTEVEEIKLFVRMLPIWATNLLFQAVYAQTITFFTRQASTLDGRIGTFTIPPASFNVFNALALMLTTCTYARYLAPLLRKLTKNPRGLSLLQRMGAGMFLTTLSMVAAALTETRRLSVARDSGMLDQADDPLPMTIFWLLPQYVIGGIADSLTIVADLEFFYSEAPDHMRSLATALCYSITGIGYFLSSGIITLCNLITSSGGRDTWFVDSLNRSHLDRFYWLLACLSCASMLAFFWVSSRYQYKEGTCCAPKLLLPSDQTLAATNEPVERHGSSRCSSHN